MQGDDAARTRRMAMVTIGAVLALAATLPDMPWLRLLLAAAGVALLAAASRRPRPRPAEQRRDLILRREVDEFILTVRRVYASAMAAGRMESGDAETEFQMGCEELVARAEEIGMIAWRNRRDDPPDPLP